jgi:hypothetical protein
MTDVGTRFSDGDVVVAVQDGAIHLRAKTDFGDPVELSSEEARQVARELLKCADILDSE